MNAETRFSQLAHWTDERTDEVEPFQKFRRRDCNRMPVAAHRSAKNGSFKTAGSRRATRRVSRISGGSHQRRVHKFQW